MARPRWLPVLLACLALACGAAPVAEQTKTTAPPAPSPPAHAERSPSPPAAELAPSAVATIPELPPSAEQPAPRVLEHPLVDPSETRALVLMYHSFDRGSADLTVDGWQLDRQLVWLRENHIEIVTTSELVSFLHGERNLPARVAVVTIDDGDKSVYKVAWPVLKKNKAPFTLGLPTKLMQENKKHRMLTWEQVREMVASGLCEVGSHGHEHKSIVHFSGDRAKRELETSRDILERETGQRPSAYFYPLGSFDARTSEIVEQVGYRAAFKATGAPVSRGCGDLYSIPRVGIIHRDTVWTLGWYYSPSFLEQMIRIGCK